MNCVTCQLKELELESTEIGDVLRCILHTIFFHRTLSLVRPKDVDCDFFEITYSGLSSTAPLRQGRRRRICDEPDMGEEEEARLLPAGAKREPLVLVLVEELAVVATVDGVLGAGGAGCAAEAEMRCQRCQGVQCGLPELEKEVDEKIDQFVAWVEKHPNRKSQVGLSFFDEKNKHPGWFGNKTERVYWEQWLINLHVMSPKRYSKSSSSKGLTNIGGNALEETSSRRSALESSIHEVLFQIINFANEKKDHIPAIPDRIFNHEIMIPSSSDSVFGWNTDVLRRVLNSGHPYSL
ncbi:hypothetical protein EJB05_01891 [Eragrostis curvula]|uniref:Autophagy-related protein 101 n=1 Tax=Eragrostis curvula TaxID=38414 RepID=A0A5J9WQV3_9POAL|nr:hypothetical protein EJB05_01891 [Eragrostis curvula]